MKTIDLQAEQTTAVALTRKEKLLRWAELVRQQPHRLVLFHHLEHWDEHRLRASTWSSGHNAFALAAADPVFRAAGLQGDSVRNAMDFFELKQEEMHEFSCDCGGSITNAKMADRIAHMAGARGAPSMLGRLASGFLR